MNGSLSLKISVGILLFVTAVLVVSLGFLFLRSRMLVKQEAMECGERALDNTAQRVSLCLGEAEVATKNIVWLVPGHLQKDSLLNYTRRVVELNPRVNGCSITMEPTAFTLDGKNFSAYSLRQNDTILTTVEGQYDYYSKVWYDVPPEVGSATWVDPYNDFNEGTLSSVPMIASYSMPLHDARGNFLGIISTDIAITQFDEIISAQKPYSHSYGVLLGSKGNYFVHPDKMKLVKQTIFTAYEEKEHPDIIQLGKEMVSGKVGNMKVKLDGQDCIVFYRPVPDTAWSIALVVPESDIFEGYTRLTYIVVPLLLIGLLLLLVFCWKGVAHFIKPLGALADQAHRITQGHYDEHMPPSQRIDVVGHLQNNFIFMQDTIDKNISSIREMNRTMEQRNAELVEANQLAQEADARKVAFLQDMSLQLRTPLNIIAGFMQVLSTSSETLTEEEVQTQLASMKEHTMSMRRMARMIFDSSWMENRPTLDLTKEVSIHEVAHKLTQDFLVPSPHDIELLYTNTVPENKCVHSNYLYLHRVLRELLYNAKKFSTGKQVIFRVEEHPDLIRFIVEDTGTGIAPEEREHLFEPFFKRSTFTQGLGLGLSLSRQTVTLLGGTLKLDTTYTEGARFIVEIPNN